MERPAIGLAPGRGSACGWPPHILLVLRLRDIGVMNFRRAQDVIAESRASVGQALPMPVGYKSTN